MSLASPTGMSPAAKTVVKDINKIKEVRNNDFLFFCFASLIELTSIVDAGTW